VTGPTQALRKYGGVVLLLAATLFYTVSYIPSVFFGGINSDELEVLVFYHDIFESGHSPAGWILPGASCLFPDWSVCFLLNYLLHDGLAGDVVLQVLSFMAWLALFFIGYRLCGGKRSGVFLSFLVLISVLVARSNLSHVGTMLNAVACLDLILFAARTGSVFRYMALAAVVFLGAASDPLFIVIFVCPALAALVTESLFHPSNRKAARRPVAVIFPGAILGYMAAPWIFPVPTARAMYTQFRPENILTCLENLWKDLGPAQHPWFVPLFAADMLILVAGGAAAVFFRNQVRKSSPILVFLFVYTFALIMANWAALLLTNNWSMRYVYFSLVWPPLLGAGFLSEAFSARSWPGRLLAVGVALYTIQVALHPLPKSAAYLAALKRAPDLRALMAQEHMEAGFAQYWYANITTYLSGETVPLRPITETGNIRHWFSNLEWYRGETDVGPLPKFRFILMPTLDPEALRARYGPPDRIATTSLNEEVWIYSEANAIRYNRIFGELGNRHVFPGPNQAWFTAAALPSQTGRLEGTARIARAGRDPAGCLTFGPYLHIKPGRYQANYSYTYLKAPARDKPVTFDCVLRLDKENYLDVVPIPYRDGTPQVLSRRIVVPPHPDDATLEMRLHYLGSGDVRVDSLQITYLGP
jgi:hypothetical protein